MKETDHNTTQIVIYSILNSTAEEMATVLSEIWTATRMTKNQCSKQKHPHPSNLIYGNLFPTGLISECGQLAFMQLKKKKINKQWHILKSSLILNAIYQQYLSLAIQNTYKPWFVVFTCIFFHWIRQNDWYYCHTSYDNK